jgi:hypothetical protein
MFIKVKNSLNKSCREKWNALHDQNISSASFFFNNWTEVNMYIIFVLALEFVPFQEPLIRQNPFEELGSATEMVIFSTCLHIDLCMQCVQKVAVHLHKVLEVRSTSIDMGLNRYRTIALSAQRLSEHTLELLIRIWDAAWLSSINVMTMLAVITVAPKTAFLQTGDKPADPHDIVIRRWKSESCSTIQ